MTDAAESYGEKLRRLDALTARIEAAEDSELRTNALEIVRLLLEINAEAVERMLEIVFESGADGAARIDEMARDPRVESLLLLYGLHPLAAETRLAQTLENLRPELEAGGAGVEMIGAAGGLVKLRLYAAENSGAALAKALADALRARVPDAVFEIETVRPPKFVRLVRKK